jgi:hypothetical protein
LEWDDFIHPETQEYYKDVIIGGGFTNRPIAKNMVPINFSELYEERSLDDNANREVTPMTEVVDESKEMEHSEPGTGSPPVPRTDEDGSDDKSIESGSRRDTPPIAEDQVDNELDGKLRETLGLDKDADIIKAVADMKAEVEPLREAAKTFSERKKFAEQYPDEAAELERLKARNRENEAKQFSERYERFTKKEGDKEVTTAFGLSSLSLEKIETVHKKFSEGSATVADLADVLDTIGEHGIVDYSERGTSRRNAEPAVSDDPGKAFAEKVKEIETEDKIPYAQAIGVAAKRHPDLYEGYRKQVSQGREE